MNLSLIDPFVLAQDYPDSLTCKLSEHESRLSPVFLSVLKGCRFWACGLHSLQPQRRLPCLWQGNASDKFSDLLTMPDISY